MRAFAQGYPGKRFLNGVSTNSRGIEVEAGT